MHRRFGLSFVVLLGTVLSACVATSTSPLSSPTDAKHDERLFGLWRPASGKENTYLHFGRGLNGLTSITMVEHKSDGSMDVSKYIMFPTEIENRRYMNVQSEGKGNYLLFKYSLGKDQLTVWLIDDRAVREAIGDGKLVGTVTTRNDGGTVETTYTVPHLAEFFTQGDQQLFREPGVFESIASK